MLSDFIDSLLQRCVGVRRYEAFLSCSRPAEERNEKRNGEIYADAVVDGKRDESAAAGRRDNRKGGVAAGSSALAYRGERAEEAAKNRGAEDDEQFTENVVEQGEGAQGGTAQLRDEDAGKGVVAETGTDGQPVGHAVAGKECGGECRADPCGEDGGEGKQHQPLVHLPQLATDFIVLPDAESHASQQKAKGAKSRLCRQEPTPIIISSHAPKNKETRDDQAVAHLGSKRHCGLPRVAGGHARSLSFSEVFPTGRRHKDGGGSGASCQGEGFRPQSSHVP